MKITEENIAKRGMNCALCIAYQSKIKPCPGCRNNLSNARRGCQNCYYYRCNPKLAYCYECEKFPCQKLRKLDQRYIRKYHMSMIENLLNIKEHVIDNFISQQEKKYTCKNCQEIISVHRDYCLNCKNKIDFDDMK